MPDVSVIAPAPVENANTEPPPEQTTNTIGIIYPPPEVRNIVDKTASFVARNGPEFENRIRQNELGNPKFNFLSAGDPYHAYYQQKVKDIRDGKGNDQNASALPASLQKLSVTSAAHQKQQELLKQITEQQFVPKDPPPEFEFIADPPSISAMDLDIVKLTAQFVARNGRQFLTNLMNREQRNYQFDFLRPQHSLFQYFTKLLEQYTKVLIPPKELMSKLDNEAKGGDFILEQVKYRADWIKHQEAQKRKEEEKIERERVAYAQIDWHEFVVVETVDYQPFEQGNFPPPTTPDDVGARVLMQERLDDDEDIEMQLESDSDEDEESESTAVSLSVMEDRTNVRDNNQIQDMDEDSSDEDEGKKQKDSASSQPSTENLMEPPSLDKVVIKKYDPKKVNKPAKSENSEDFLISPITGERIPVNKVAEHMRIGLLDPRWVEMRGQQSDKQAQENVYAAGSAIEASLKQLAERRTDIFGVGDEEAAIGKKIGEEESRKEERVTWDGHTSSVEAATRAARANITLEEQIHQIHKVKGLLPDEEKEKIGPKPVSGRPVNVTKPVINKSVSAAPVLTAQPVSQSTAPMMTQAPIMAQPPPMMMMQPMRPMMARPAYGVPSQLPYLGPPGMPTMSPANIGHMPPMPPMPPPPQMPGKHGLEMSAEDDIPSKKQRSEDSLVPEQVFLARNPSPVNFKVLAPMVPDKPEWRLNGQMLSIVMALTDNIGSLKSRIQEETGMPPAKQKLSYDGLFYKDTNSLAFYNISPGTVVTLQVKERGGRRN